MVLIVFAITIFSIGCSRIKGPVEIVVTQDGSSGFDSIQDAVDEAPDGSTIRIAPGHYVETVLIEKPLTLIGAGWRETSLAPPGGDRGDVESMVRKINHEFEFAKTPEERNAVQLKLMAKKYRPHHFRQRRERRRHQWIENHSAAVRSRNVSTGPVRPWDSPTQRGGLSDCAVTGSTIDGVNVIGDSDVTD